VTPSPGEVEQVEFEAELMDQMSRNPERWDAPQGGVEDRVEAQ
jgi:hypothetical protein